MSDGDVTTLENIKWDWFGSCTVAVRDASDVFLKKKAFALFRGIARNQHIHFHFLIFAYRIESGVDPQHRHFHFLMGALNHKGQAERFRAMALWDRLLGSTPDHTRGTCRIRLYNAAEGLSAYLAKHLNSAEVQSWMSGNSVFTSRAAFRYAFQRRLAVEREQRHG